MSFALWKVFGAIASDETRPPLCVQQVDIDRTSPRTTQQIASRRERDLGIGIHQRIEAQHASGGTYHNYHNGCCPATQNSFGGFFAVASTQRDDPHFIVQVDPFVLATVTPVAVSLMAVTSHRNPCSYPKHSRVIRRHLGGYLEGRAKEKDIAHEEETQAFGRKGVEGCDISKQVPGLRSHQEDAHSLPFVHG